MALRNKPKHYHGVQPGMSFAPPVSMPEENRVPIGMPPPPEKHLLWLDIPFLPVGRTDAILDLKATEFIAGALVNYACPHCWLNCLA